MPRRLGMERRLLSVPARRDGSVFELVWLAQAVQDAMRSARCAVEPQTERPAAGAKAAGRQPYPSRFPPGR